MESRELQKKIDEDNVLELDADYLVNAIVKTSSLKKRGGLTVIAGFPGSGKTYLIQKMIEAFSTEENMSICYSSPFVQEKYLELNNDITQITSREEALYMSYCTIAATVKEYDADISDDFPDTYILDGFSFTDYKTEGSSLSKQDFSDMTHHIGRYIEDDSYECNIGFIVSITQEHDLTEVMKDNMTQLIIVGDKEPYKNLENHPRNHFVCHVDSKVGLF